MKITDDVLYVGVNDRKTKLFEGQYPVPNGISYNSYVIKDEKTAVLDTVDRGFTAEWLAAVDAALCGNAPDYLIVQHMEPDHSASIADLLARYPSVTVVASNAAFNMMKNFYSVSPTGNRLVVSNGDVLKLGKHILTFLTAPMVHWPEVIVTYDETEKLLFSADAFGKFGVPGTDEPWEDEARRYYIGIVGKYGTQVQALLKKAAGVEIKTICPLHGPVLTGDISHYVGLYDTWSSYRPETDGVTICYTSVYGNTKEAALFLADALKENGAELVDVYDLSRDDMSAAVASAFKNSKLVLATTTYNADIFPFMRDLIVRLTEHGFRDRTVALIENGSWAPTAAKVMKSMFDGSAGIVFAENGVKILSALNEENRSKIKALAKELCEKDRESH